VQWLARAARAYVPPEPDDGHTNLGWDDTLDGFTTHGLKNGMPLSLKIADLTLVLHGDERTAGIQSFSLNDRTDVADVADALLELSAWFANAELSLVRIQRQMIGRQLAASDVRCWPHHFDLATLVSFPALDAKVGVGLAPGDEYYDEPYFYVSVYPQPDSVALPHLPNRGHWHTHEFTAAVMPAHQIVAANNQKAVADEFLIAAVDVAIKILK
jgi:hypothetical protein